jgi:predicted transcriptional regulator of viral defense system
LYAIAEKQTGFVTTAQAAGVGVRPMTLVMMGRRGALKRVSRGVYRLVDFPGLPLARFMAAALWPYELRGVLSHQSALALHGLFNDRSADVHITVPAAFRIQRRIPPGLIVHRADLSDSDTCQLECVPVTTPERTIRDCIESNLEPSTVVGAIEHGLRATLFDAVTAAMLERRFAVRPQPTGISPVGQRAHEPFLRAARPRASAGSTRTDGEA